MATRIEALANPALITWARETAGFSVDAAAERLKVSLDRLRAWEGGETRPSVPQLRKLAEVYKRPLAAFYLPRPPAADEPVHDFRRIHGEPIARSSPELLLAIRQSRERRELALDLICRRVERCYAVAWKIHSRPAIASDLFFSRERSSQRTRASSRRRGASAISGETRPPGWARRSAAPLSTAPPTPAGRQ